MASGEISVTKRLENCNGNLVTISNCAASTKVKEGVIKESQGDVQYSTADSAESTCSAGNRAMTAFSTLISSSIKFFDQAGRKFDGADEKAASSIEGEH